MRSVVLVMDARMLGYRDKIYFMTWIQKQDIPNGTLESRLASGLSSQITTWQGYAINGYRFHTKEKDKKSAAHNCGV
jgi:hypothetical protein